MSGIITTGQEPLIIGSDRTFELQAYRDGLPWILTGGSALLLLKDPAGTAINIAASVSGSTAQADWTAIGPAGVWRRAWDVTDASGEHEVTGPIAFTVAASP